MKHIRFLLLARNSFGESVLCILFLVSVNQNESFVARTHPKNRAGGPQHRTVLL